MSAYSRQFCDGQKSKRADGDDFDDVVVVVVVPSENSVLIRERRCGQKLVELMLRCLLEENDAAADGESEAGGGRCESGRCRCGHIGAPAHVPATDCGAAEEEVSNRSATTGS